MLFDIRLLGPFEAMVNDVSIVPSAAKPRQLLAMLAINSGHVVTTSMLMTEIWGQRPPRSATSTLQTYIGRIRVGLEQALGDSSTDKAKKILATEHIGYRLNVPDQELDSGRYEQLARAGRTAAEHGDYDTASRMLTAALELWRGSALSDVAAGPHLTAETARMEETRLSDLDLRLEADLRLGRNRQLLGELAGLCARYPLSENFHGKYVIALCRLGQQWRALEAIQRLRDTMIDELGLDPSVGMRRLHQAVLRGDPTVDDLRSHASQLDNEPAILPAS